ncbi:unnamed protein product [Porites lobata]|uniref:Uncharacterized protein n=1 Tax=Porites lobata TaxID=104759 RepID=A0ABN8NBP1_9CNID|nr:unnamed protein product [Porites lobata]
MTTVREGYLRDLPHPNLNDVLKSNTHSAIKLLKTVGEFAHKVATLKEQLGNQLLSVVESFRKKNTEMKRDRNALSSAFSCWEALLGEYEKQAQDMLKVSSSLARQVNTAVFEEVIKKKSVTKKIFSFRESGENQIEKADDVLQKCHKEYSEACTKLAKLQSTGAEAGKQEHVQTLCRNTHNAYVLQLNTVNSMNRVFYSTTLPEMLDDLQLVQEDVSESLKIAVSDFSKIEKDNIVESVQRLESIEHMFQMMDSRVDISTFVQANNPGMYTPPVKSFSKPEESQSLNLVENKLFLVDVTEPVLKRKYIALQKKLRNFDTSIKKEQEAVKSLKQLQESYLQNPSYGNAGEVEQDLLRQRNDLRVKEWFCCVAKDQTKLFTGDVLNRLHVTEDDLQDETISDDDSSVTGTVDKRQSVHVKGKKIRKAGQHEFEDHTFKKPKFCFYCKGLIKGLRRQGVRCKACKMSVHHKCRDNVPYCRGEVPVGKGQSLRIQRTDEDDSDDHAYSDVEDVPTPPPHRRALGPTASLPTFRTNDFYDTAESIMVSSTANNYCVALYDFGGENDGDLKLCAGEKVKVINSADEHWWEGSSKGKTGFFPASYVQVISPDDVILRCLFDFAGQEGDELTIQANQIIVQVRNEGNGWIVGQTGSVEGAFPASYVEVLSNNGPD